MGTFTADISNFIKKTEMRSNLALRKIALQTYTKVQKRTPVDSGELRKSWTISINALPTSFNGNPADIGRAKFGDTIYIATDKPYATMLEYGLYPNPPKNPTGKTKGGYSIQAPKGMVRISIAETTTWFNSNAGRF
ncbi:HK97 gp10 family phage protein [Phocoenobacter skyensis]|uniref:Bacteriophage HK97-gp10, putative tail-component n=1 Tax=Phocoenobacter skyensis TaxID=97481 RepID=A0A1H8A0P6_9PAST|nr:HK97 gp10 family phage protein [Pasteurella skyensis]MDP8184406.1 HK97 gp10 family phage protein [Pasteurella skyensis]QLB22592.1 hypothetical protein A6B44_04980 [Pasteurella skyensis]SEM63484.1 Bacteriophage HK97-gp10, putative tail-component [Pasteurella skyensis]